MIGPNVEAPDIRIFEGLNFYILYKKSRIFYGKRPSLFLPRVLVHLDQGS